MTTDGICLLDCLEAYTTLDEEQAQQLKALPRTERYQGAEKMAETTYEKGMQRGSRKTLEKQLEDRFSPLTGSAKERLEGMESDGLAALTLELLTAQSLKELGMED